jgi:hypothetical protein
VGSSLLKVKLVTLFIHNSNQNMLAWLLSRAGIGALLDAISQMNDMVIAKRACYRFLLCPFILQCIITFAIKV